MSSVVIEIDSDFLLRIRQWMCKDGKPCIPDFNSSELYMICKKCGKPTMTKSTSPYWLISAYKKYLRQNE